MKKILYHGSSKIIKNPSLETGVTAKDFGVGFYVSENLEVSKEWACKLGQDGFVSAYSLETDGLNLMKLNSKAYNLMNWLAICCENRVLWTKNSLGEEAKRFIQTEYAVDTSEVDIIIGYRGDDSYSSCTRAFLNGEVSFQRYKSIMQQGKAGEQLVLKSQKALDALMYLGNDYVAAREAYQKKVNRDLSLLEKFQEFKPKKGQEEFYITDIMKGRVKNDDLCL